MIIIHVGITSLSRSNFPLDVEKKQFNKLSKVNWQIVNRLAKDLLKKSLNLDPGKAF